MRQDVLFSLSDINIFSDEISSIYGKNGFVYLIHDKCRDILKIGKTIQPKRRLKPLLVIAGISNSDIYISNKLKFYSLIEEEIHRQFEENRLIGEWFKVNPSEVIEFCSGKRFKYNSSTKNITVVLARKAKKPALSKSQVIALAIENLTIIQGVEK